MLRKIKSNKLYNLANYSEKEVILLIFRRDKCQKLKKKLKPRSINSREKK